MHAHAHTHTHVPQAIPGGSEIKNRPRGGFDHWVGKVPWRRAWQPTLVFLAGESHGKRSLAGTVHGVTKS